METSHNQDKSSAQLTGTPSTKGDSHLSTINVVRAFKRHRLYRGWTLTEVIQELENLAKVSLDYPDENVLTAIRCLTERAVEIQIDGDGAIPGGTVPGGDAETGGSTPDRQSVEIPEGASEPSDVGGVLQA